MVGAPRREAFPDRRPVARVRSVSRGEAARHAGRAGEREGPRKARRRAGGGGAGCYRARAFRREDPRLDRGQGDREGDLCAGQAAEPGGAVKEKERSRVRSRGSGVVRIWILAALPLLLAVAGCGYSLVGRTSTLPASIKIVQFQTLANQTQRVGV